MKRGHTAKDDRTLRQTLVRQEVALAPLSRGKGDLRAAACYPHRYAVGMASLGFQIVWGMLANHDAFTTERYFASLEDRPPQALVPNPVSLETGTPLKNADLIAFAAYYEIDYFRIAGMLAGAGITPWAAERGEFDPLVIIGGPAVTSNPEPLAPFADAIVLGDAEETFPRLLDTVAATAGERRDKTLELLAAIPGVYVPAFFRVVLGPKGQLGAVVPVKGAAETPKGQIIADLTPYRGGSWLATPKAEFGKTLLLEPIRGCGRQCGFCVTRVISSPPRRRAMTTLWPLVDEAAGKVKKVSLVGAALADYPDIVALAEGIVDRGLGLAVSSLAVGAPATPALARLVGASGQKTVTLAPEAATPEARARLGKAFREGALEEAIEAAAAASVSNIKLYYIIGTPGETAEEVIAIGTQIASLHKVFKKIKFEVRVNPLVPKPGTAFAHASFIDRRGYQMKISAIKKEAAKAAVRFGSWREAWWQTAIGRGDRAMARRLAAGPSRPDDCR